jgi:hypothetical protein
MRDEPDPFNWPTQDCPTCDGEMGSDGMYYEGQFICGHCLREARRKLDEVDCLLALAKIISTFDHFPTHWYELSTTLRVRYLCEAEQILAWHRSRGDRTA